MPTKTAKPVIVSVYVEGPKRTRNTATATTTSSSSNKDDHLHNHHHHHHHHYHYVDKSVKQDVNLQNHADDQGGNGYSRRAQLLHYSQCLRKSAKVPPQSSPSKSKLISSTPSKSKLISSNHHHHSKDNVAVQRKPKYSRSTTCLGNWRIFFPKFCRSLSSSEARKDMKKKKHVHSKNNAMKEAMKNLQQQKKRGFISKLLSTSGKNKVKSR